MKRKGIAIGLALLVSAAVFAYGCGGPQKLAPNDPNLKGNAVKNKPVMSGGGSNAGSNTPGGGNGAKGSQAPGVTE